MAAYMESQLSIEGALASLIQEPPVSQSPPSGSSSNEQWKLIAGVTLGVGGTLLALAVAAFIITARRKW